MSVQYISVFPQLSWTMKGLAVIEGLKFVAHPVATFYVISNCILFHYVSPCLKAVDLSFLETVTTASRQMLAESIQPQKSMAHVAKG